MILLRAALILSLSGALPAMAQQASQTRSLFPSQARSAFPAPPLRGQMSPRWPSARDVARKLEQGALAAGDFATSAPVGSALDALKEASVKDTKALTDARKSIARDADDRLSDLSKRLGPSADPKVRGALDDTRRQIKAEVSALEADAKRAAAQGGFLSKLGNALNILDFLSVASQGAGYLAEGDRTGAAGVVANELAKKASEGLGAFLTYFVPGAPVFGTWAGNKLWEHKIKPEIDAREQALREAELRRAVQGKPWLVPKTFLDANGQVRELEEDQYVERGTGLIRRRTPEEQAGYEKVEHAKWQSARLMDQIQQDYVDGKIDDRRLAELQVSYRQRNLMEPWQPIGYAPFPTEESEAVSEAPSEETSPANADAVLATVAPVALTASGLTIETFADWGDVMTTYELAFWNLGALSPAHGQAVMKITSSADGSFAVTGTFSGGPNGTLTFRDPDGGVHTFRVEGGTHVVAEVERLVNNGTEVEVVTLIMPLSDPHAFDGWPTP